MTDRHGRIPRQQQLRQRLADDVAAADDDGMLAGQGNFVVIQYCHDRPWRAGRPWALAGGHQPDVQGMQRIHILVRIDAANDNIRIDLARHRHHRQNTADFRIPVQLFDQFQNLLLGRFPRQGRQMIGNAEIAAQFPQPLGVNDRGVIVADQQHRQSAGNLLFTQCFRFFSQPGPQQGGGRFSFHEQRHAGKSS